MVGETATMSTPAQYRQWADNARAMASRLPDGADRDTLLTIARLHEEAAWRLEQPAELKDAAD